MCFRYDDFDERDREPPRYDQAPRYDREISYDGEREYQSEPSKFDDDGAPIDKPAGGHPSTFV